MNNDLVVAQVLFSIIGIFNILLGYLIKRYKLVNIIAGFNPAKDDKIKTADIYGSNFMLMGLLMILITIIYYIIPSQNINLYYFYMS